MLIFLKQVIPASSPTQLEEIPPTEDMAMVENVEQGQAFAQRSQRRGRNEGKFAKFKILKKKNAETKFFPTCGAMFGMCHLSHLLQQYTPFSC